MRFRHPLLFQNIENSLGSYTNRPLPGIDRVAAREAFISQVIESIRRIDFIRHINSRAIDEGRIDASTTFFDPLRAAILHYRDGNINEAFWLIFLAIHFGKSGTSGWELTRNVYGALGNPVYWSWEQVSSDPSSFRQWLCQHETQLKNCGRFGNHRKYESLNGDRPSGTGNAVESYVNWIGPNRDHLNLIQRAPISIQNNPRALFSFLYNSMDNVKRFGRTARFDYLTMIGKLGFVNIEPGSTFMKGATGPISGAKLLFGGSLTSPMHYRDLDNWLIDLERHMGLYYGMQVLEDALCNWQKSPLQFRPFRG